MAGRGLLAHPVLKLRGFVCFSSPSLGRSSLGIDLTTFILTPLCLCVAKTQEKKMPAQSPSKLAPLTDSSLKGGWVFGCHAEECLNPSSPRSCQLLCPAAVHSVNVWEKTNVHMLPSHKSTPQHRSQRCKHSLSFKSATPKLLTPLPSM